MNIIIAGCGRVGSEIVASLSGMGHEVTVIDTDYEAIRRVTAFADVMGYQGDSASVHSQSEAGIEKADLFIASTSSDEKNMLACLIARKTGQCRTIAIVRSPQYAEDIEYLREELGLSMSINPEKVAADEMMRLIQIPSAFEVDTFAKGKVSLISVKVPENSPLSGTRLCDLPSRTGVSSLICIIERGGDVIIPDGSDTLYAGDKISVTLSLKDVSTFLTKVGLKNRKVKNVMIAGGGTMAYYLAKQLLSIRVNVKIIEKSRERCELLSELLPGAMIICGDATDKGVLLEESVGDMDVVCGLMSDDEENIMLSLYLDKTAPDTKVMTRFRRTSYDDIVSELPVGSIISTKKIATDYIIRYVRSMRNESGSDVETLYRMLGDRVEALELSVGDDFRGGGVPLKDLEIAEDTLICCIYRSGQVIRPGGADTIEPGDSVVVVTARKDIENIHQIVKR